MFVNENSRAIEHTSAAVSLVTMATVLDLKQIHKQE